jgi:hypothetical protein
LASFASDQKQVRDVRRRNAQYEDDTCQKDPESTLDITDDHVLQRLRHREQLDFGPIPHRVRVAWERVRKVGDQRNHLRARVRDRHAIA